MAQAERLKIPQSPSDVVHRLLREEAALRRVATLVAEGRPESVVLEAVVVEAGQLFSPTRIQIARFSPDRYATIIAGSEDGPFAVGSRWALGAPNVFGSVFDTGRVARFEEPAQNVGPAVGAPIVVDGATWGVVVAVSPTPNLLSSESEARLVGFAELVASAITNVQAREELHALAEAQGALRRVATLVAAGAEPQAVFTAVAVEAAHVLGVGAVSLIRYDADSEMFTKIYGTHGDRAAVADGAQMSRADCPEGAMVLETGGPVRLDDWTTLPGPVAARHREQGFGQAVAAPVIVDGSMWGQISAFGEADEVLPPGCETQLAEFTQLVSTSISNAQAGDDVRRLLDEQAALRRVATLIAEGADPAAVFEAVCAETGRLIGATSVNLARYTPDGFHLTLAGWSLHDAHIPVGTRLPLAPDTLGDVIRRAGAPARLDSYEAGSSELATIVRELGIRSSVGAPVIVEGQPWGALVVGTDGNEPMPAGTEVRLARFTELVATAISNTDARAQVIASRARIVAAGDEARRRIERNLHDGTQQRLLALGLDLQRIRATIPDGQLETHSGLAQAERDLDSVLEEVRELSRGLHPALLSRGGLRLALRALARRSPIPVSMTIDLATRPPPSIETAVYYLVSEALTNTIKHSRAAAISIGITTERLDPSASGDRRGRQGLSLRAVIADDGIGGAEPSEGSGLMGAVDRVDALGGRLTLDSRPGRGTTILIELPLARPGEP
jgi:signal transduction histidine kinase